VTNLAGVVGVEMYPLHTGSPALTNAYARRLSEAAIRQNTRAQGIIDARFTDCQPGTTYYYRMQVWDDFGQTAVWPPSGPLPSATTARETSFAIQSRQLLLSLPGLNPSGTVVVLSNSNTPSLLAAVAGDGAPGDQVYFSLGDLLSAGGATNYLPLGNQQFTASALGSVSNQFSSQSYTIDFTTDFVVGQGSAGSLGNYAVLTVGSAVTQAGEAAAIPVGLYASGITNLTCEIGLPTNLFATITLQAVSPQLGSASLRLVSSNAVQLSFAALPGQALAGNQRLALLNLATSTNQTSAFVPLSVESLQGSNSDGSPVSDLAAQSGRLAIVGEAPLLEMLPPDANGVRNLALYGLTGANFEIQYSTNLISSSYWSNYVAFTATSLTSVFSDLDESQPALFYRAFSFTGTPPSGHLVEPGNKPVAPGDDAMADPARTSAIIARYPLLKFTAKEAPPDGPFATPGNRRFILRVNGR
jgi:hypothetical protein